jgi:hypothetical protein
MVGEAFQVPHFETDVVQDAPNGWRDRIPGARERRIHTWQVVGIELIALARNRAKYLRTFQLSESLMSGDLPVKHRTESHTETPISGDLVFGSEAR